jgi:NAD(P)-dependent dehydrogenase (short-subunit alcohol dehydrogenase family)
MKRYPGKRVLITGAGSGLGRALSIEFAKLGWNVGVAEIHPGRADECCEIVNGSGGKALKIICDVSRLEDIEAAGRLIEEKWGGLDIVINNAGVSCGGYMEDIPMEKWEWVIGINLMSVIYGCRTFIPMLKKQRSGHIVNVASYFGFFPPPESATYNMTKAGVISLSETLRTELSPHNIGVSVVMPSFFKTNLMDQLYMTDSIQVNKVKKLFEKAKFTSEKVAQITLRSIDKNRLHILPQLDAKAVWVLKRISPRFLFWANSLLYRYHIVERILGLEY